MRIQHQSQLQFDQYKWLIKCKRKIEGLKSGCLQQVIIIFFYTMINSKTLKYQCGCGKEYSSYPAFSTHKRLKHLNQAVSGTSLPKNYLPKRGRPSFSLPPQRKRPHFNTYAALTIVETALLKLQQRYSLVLNQPEAESDLGILNIYNDCQKSISNDTGTSLAESIKRFNQVIINHAIQQISTPISYYLLQITLFFLENIKASSVKLDWEVTQKGNVRPVQTYLFNRFFSVKKNMQRVQQYAKDADKPLKFFFQVAVTLSQYLCKLGLIEAVLELKQ